VIILKRQQLILRLAFIFIFLFITGCATTQSEWKKAQKKNSIRSYSSFLLDHKDSKYANEARQRIWDITQEINSIENYTIFIQYYPKSIHKDEAVSRLNKLKDEAAVKLMKENMKKRWEYKVKGSMDLYAYLDFINDFSQVINPYYEKEVIYGLSKLFAGPLFSEESSEKTQDIVDAFRNLEDSTIEQFVRTVNFGKGVSIYPYGASCTYIVFIFDNIPAEVLRGFGNQRPDLFIKLLKDDVELVRIKAAQSLSTTCNPKTVEPLILSLADKSPTVRFYAAYSLSATKAPEAVKPLIKLLKDEYIRIRIIAVNTLGEIGNPEAVEAIASLVLKEKIKDLPNLTAIRVRSAINALSKIQDPTAVNALVKLIDKPIKFKRCIEDALIRIGSPSVQPLIEILDIDSPTQKSVIEILGEIGDKRAVTPLIDKLQKDTRLYVKKYNLIKKNKPYMLTGFSNKNDVCGPVWEIIEALNAINDPRAITPINNCLKVLPFCCPTRAINNFGKVAVEPLISLLANSRNDQLKKNVAMELMRIGEPSFLPLRNKINRIQGNGKFFGMVALYFIEKDNRENLLDKLAKENKIDLDKTFNQHQLIISQGKKGTEWALFLAFLKKGGRDMLTTFLNSGNPMLSDVAEFYAVTVGYQIHYSPESWDNNKKTKWGGD